MGTSPGAVPHACACGSQAMQAAPAGKKTERAGGSWDPPTLATVAQGAQLSPAARSGVSQGRALPVEPAAHRGGEADVDGAAVRGATGQVPGDEGPQADEEVRNGVEEEGG